jgi:hypothetical protein
MRQEPLIISIWIIKIKKQMREEPFIINIWIIKIKKQMRQEPRVINILNNEMGKCSATDSNLNFYLIIECVINHISMCTTEESINPFVYAKTWTHITGI